MALKHTILVAEDNESDVIIFQHAFSSFGLKADVRFSRGGQETIDYISGKNAFANRAEFPFPEVLLLDLNMPLVGGFAVLEWLHAHPPLNRLRVIVFSSSEDPNDVDRAYDLGASSYLIKPMSFDGMKPILECLAHWMAVNRFSQVPF